MQLRLSKCQVVIPGVVHYQKAISILTADDEGGSARLEVYDRREKLLNVFTAPNWRKLPGKDWELYEGDTRLAYLEATNGCNCGGTTITNLVSQAQ